MALTKVAVFGLAFGMVLQPLACATGSGATRPEKSAPAVEASFTRLISPELGSDFVGRRVRTTAAFHMMQPTMMGLPRQYQEGWTGAMMYAATVENGAAACEYSKIAAGLANLAVLAPRAIGADWADAKSGTVFEMLGVVIPSRSTSGITGASTRSLILEVEAMKALGACATQASGAAK